MWFAVKYTRVFFQFSSLYGFAATECTNYSYTRIASETHLARKITRNQLFSDKKLQITLLGAVEKPKKHPELLYAISGSQPRAEIVNQIQFAACILSQSRNIYFGKVLTFLRYFDPRLLEICYGGE